MAEASLVAGDSRKKRLPALLAVVSRKEALPQ